MKSERNRFSSTSGFLALLISVCATLASMPGSTDGISGSGIVGGYISMLRSIVVDGVHYSTDNAIVRVNGSLGDLADIQVGHQVIALVDFETYEALEIDQYDMVTGRIEEIEVWDESMPLIALRVAEQDVALDPATVFHLEADKIKKGDYVTINGLRDPDGVVHATAVEEAEDKKTTLVSGLVEGLTDDHFYLGDLRVESPYLQEFISEGWLFDGAPVQVEGEKPHEGTLEALSVRTMPVELIHLVEESEEATVFIDGTIDDLSAVDGALWIDGLQLATTERATMHDERDHVRWFGWQDVYPSDVVLITAVGDGDRLVVRKLVRVDKADRRLRAPVAASEPVLRTLTLLDGRRLFLDEVKDLRFAGKKVDADGMLALVHADDALEVTWKKDGKLKRVEATPRCGHEAERWDEHRRRRDMSKDEWEVLKDTLKTLKKDDLRAWACLVR